MHLIWPVFQAAFCFQSVSRFKKIYFDFFVNGAESFVLGLHKGFQALGEETHLQIDLLEFSFFKPHFDCPSGSAFLLGIYKSVWI
jgi:hypothetical protein